MKIKSAVFVTSAARAAQFPDTVLPEVAFAGRSNVGKSSLLNRLVNRNRLALTGQTPGKTRLVNFFLVNDSFFLVDLPGYGFARVSQAEKRRWAAVTDDYLQGREQLKLVVLLLDIRHAPTADDQAMYNWLVHFQVPAVIVAAKADKVARGRWQARIEEIRKVLGLGPRGPVIPFSAQTGQGWEELWQLIAQYVSEFPDKEA
jgi:GTP-binding protein